MGGSDNKIYKCSQSTRIHPLVSSVKASKTQEEQPQTNQSHNAFPHFRRSLYGNPLSNLRPCGGHKPIQHFGRCSGYELSRRPRFLQQLLER